MDKTMLKLNLFARISVASGRFLAGCHSPMYNPVHWDRPAPVGRDEMIEELYSAYFWRGFVEIGE